MIFLSMSSWWSCSRERVIAFSQAFRWWGGTMTWQCCEHCVAVPGPAKRSQILTHDTPRGTQLGLGQYIWWWEFEEGKSHQRTHCLGQSVNPTTLPYKFLSACFHSKIALNNGLFIYISWGPQIPEPKQTSSQTLEGHSKKKTVQIHEEAMDEIDICCLIVLLYADLLAVGFCFLYSNPSSLDHK